MEHKFEFSSSTIRSKKLSLRGNIKEFGFSFITLMVYILVGVSRSYLAFLFHQIDLPDSTLRLDEEQKSWIASSLGLLSPIGCLCSGTIMDFFGRKLFIHLMFIPFIISWLVITYAKSYEILFLGLAIQGIGSGMSFCVSTYISEIATTNHRGALLAVIEIAYNIGVLLSNVIMYHLKWNVVSLIFAFLSIASFLLTFYLPETPLWLYMRGQREKSIRTLCSIRCQTPEDIDFEIQEMHDYCSSITKSALRETAKNCLKAWKPLAIASCLFMLMHNTGYSIMVAYTITIVNRLEIPYDSRRVAICYSAISFIGSFITPYFMHNFGRKTILSISAFGMAISVVVMAIYEEIFYYDNNKPHVWIVPAALYVYVLLCNVGVLPIGFIVGGELFPLEVSGIMNGLYGAFAYVYWVLTLKLYPKYMHAFGIKIMLWTFAVSCFIVSAYGILVLPETKGKSLNEVQELYFNKKKKTASKEET